MRNRRAAIGTIFLLLSLVAGNPTSAADPPPRYVAVGAAGRRVYSADAVTWAESAALPEQSNASGHALFNVAFGIGRFIAVGGDGRAGYILSTIDGREWNEVARVGARVGTVTFGGDRFIAATDSGADGTGSKLLCSFDGARIRDGAPIAIPTSRIHPRRSAFGSGEAGPRFVVIGDAVELGLQHRTHWRIATEDGTSIQSVAVQTAAASDIAYGAGHFVVVGPDGLIESSHDGQNWRRHRTGRGQSFSRVVWTGTRFLVTGSTDTWSSRDGLVWTRESHRIPHLVAWAREVRSPLALALSPTGDLLTSTELVDWRKAAIPVGPPLEAVASRD